MGTEIISGVNFYPIKKIVTTGGKVMHAVKALDENLPEFGECYFSTVDSNSPKAWKKHSRMICNLFIPVGAVKFVFFDDRKDSPTFSNLVEFTISNENYGRLVIYPNIWFGFAGVYDGGESLILNVSNIKHDPAESIRLEPGASEIPYTWQF